MTPDTAQLADRIVTHLPVVGHEVNAVLRRLPRHITREELAAAGNLGLVQAARSYDPDSGVPFHRWAALRIRGAILDELRSSDWLPRSARHRARTIETVTTQLTSTLGRPATIEEVAAASGLTVTEVLDARADADVKVASLEATLTPFAETVPGEGPTPEDETLLEERLVYLRSAVVSLPDRLRTVVEGIFLLDRPVGDIADELGVTLSRVSQLKTEALGLMRDAMNASLDPALVATGTGARERRRRAYYARVAAQAASSAAATTAVPSVGAAPSGPLAATA